MKIKLWAVTVPCFEVFWPTDASGAIAVLESAGRICYSSWDNPGNKTAKQYLSNIVQKRHFSVLEHVNVSFLISEVSRALTHELVRHRHFSFSQRSTRWCDESDFSYYIPPAIAANEELLNEYKSAIEHCREVYKKIKNTLTGKRKEVNQVARYILPHSLHTELIITGNLRAWTEFLEKRDSPEADEEIRMLAKEVRKQLATLYPEVIQP